MFKRFHSKVIVICLCLAIVPALVVGAISYNVSANNIRRQVSEANINMLDEYRTKVEMLLKEVDVLSTQGMLEYGQYSEYSRWNVKDKLNMVSLVRAKAVSNNVIDSLYLYYPDSGKIVANDTIWTWNDFYDKTWEKLYRDSNAWDNNNTLWLYDRIVERPLMNETPVITVIRSFPFQSKFKYGYFVVNINKEAFFKQIDTRNDMVVILDDGGRIIKNNTGMAISDDIFDSITGLSGFFSSRISAQSMVVSYTTSPYNGWRYISLTDEAALLAPIRSVRRTILNIVVLCLSVGMILSLFASHNLMAPIKRIMDKLKGLNLEYGTDSDLACRNDNIDEEAVINDYIDRMLKDRNVLAKTLDDYKTEAYIFQKGRELPNLILKCDRESVDVLLDEIIERAYESARPEDSLTLALEYVIEVITNTIISAGYNIVEVCGKNYHQIHDEYRDLKTLAETRPFINDIITRCMAYIYSRQNIGKTNLVQLIKEYIEGNYDNPALSVDYIADKLRMNASYIGALFKEQAGMGISDFLIEVRMEKARQLLRDTGKGIQEIAYAVGYTSDHSFYCMFKKYYDVAPTSYRRSIAIKHMVNKD